MADSPPRPRSLTDSFGREIDRLMRQLPHADPHLRGDPEPMLEPQPRRTLDISPRSSAAARGSSASPTANPSASTAPGVQSRADFWGVWLRALAALALGAAVAYWPYARSCGWMLYSYLAVIGVVLVAGSWVSQSAWRTHVAAAHVVGLLVIYWGVVLAAEQVLPRIGYAAVGAAWRCVG